MKQITDFEGRTSDEVEVEYISTISGVIPVYSIKSYHSLTQFIGYGKYINNQWGNVYLRGQTSLYNGCLSPSLLRRKIISGENQLVKEKAEAATSNTVKFSNININHRFSEYKHQINESLNGTQHFTGWNKDIIEPLLQHYGIKTHWIDIVDNIWVALLYSLQWLFSTPVYASSTRMFFTLVYVHRNCPSRVLCVCRTSLPHRSARSCAGVFRPAALSRRAISFCPHPCKYRE